MYTHFKKNKYSQYRGRYIPDFVVEESDPNVGNQIMYQLFYLPTKRNFPMIIFIGGGSSHGKSNNAMAIQQAILRTSGLDLKDFIDDINIYYPLEYPEKVKAMLTQSRLRRVRMLCIHESRDIIRAKMWQSFVAQTIADINAQSRAVRPLIVMIVAQHIRNITTDVRYTLNYRIKCYRPLYGLARAYIEKVIDDDTDMENPKLKTRKITGFIRMQDGKKRVYSPQFIEIKRVSKELQNHFHQKDSESKLRIIKQKLTKLMAEMKTEFGENTDKIDLIVKYYSDHPETLGLLGKNKRGVWKLDNKVADMFEIPREDIPLMQSKLNESLKNKGYFQESEEQ